MWMTCDHYIRCRRNMNSACCCHTTAVTFKRHLCVVLSEGVHKQVPVRWVPFAKSKPINRYECYVTHIVHIPAIHQTTKAINKIQFMTRIFLLRVSAAVCHPQGVLIGYNAISGGSSQSLPINFGHQV